MFSRTVRASVALIALATLAGCAGTGGSGLPGSNGQQQSDVPDFLTVTSLGQAHHFGQTLASYYARGFESANARRRWFNIGVWAATTYTTGAAGLRAHADNILVGALAGTQLASLEPIINEGGPQAWARAHAKTVCLSRASIMGTTSEVLTDIALLEARVAAGKATTEETAALATYRGLYLSVANGYHAVHTEFIASRTGKAPSADQLQRFLDSAQAEHEKGEQAAGATTPPPAEPQPVTQTVEQGTKAVEDQLRTFDSGGTLLSQFRSEYASPLRSAWGESLSLDEAIRAPGNLSLQINPGSPAARDLSPEEVRQLLQTVQRAREAVAQSRKDNPPDDAALDNAARLAAERLKAINQATEQQIKFCI